MANHGYVSTTSCTCWDVDAFNRCGVYASGALDNGVFVTLGKPSNTSNAITGYEFPVTLASGTSKGCWVVNTPEVGTTLEMQMLSDPRTFYNEAGRPMSLKYLLPKTDCIEVNAEAFASGALPTTEGYVLITTNGKLVASATAAAGDYTYFSVLGFKDVAVGGDVMKVVVLQCENN